MNFDKAYAMLNAEQRAAVDHIYGPLLVIAGPGTGKTQLLSVRVANILKQTDANPENILCLTFTETGASNMRHRLADFIGPEAYKIQIQTYHAFGSYVIQENQDEQSNAIDELDQFALIREAQHQLPATAILRPDHQTKDIISTISDLKSALLDSAAVRTIIAKNQHDSARIAEAIRDNLAQIASLRYPKTRPHYEAILETLRTFSEEQTNPDSKIEPITTTLFRELAEVFAQDDGGSLAKPLGKWKDKFFKKDKHGALVFADEIANKKLLELAEIMEYYERRLDEQGSFDYDDMILRAIHLLETNAEVRYNIQERFQFILLDEFQDTNDAQAKLVSIIAQNAFNEAPNIMAVGDDDQAIYGFQGANTSNFYDFDNLYHPTHIFLTKNYRSSAEILDFAHNIIEQSPDRFCKAPNVNIDKRISAENPPTQTAIELREFKAFQSEYSYVAQTISSLLDSGVPGHKISIIAPKHKYLVSILPYLHAQQIPISYVKRENILEDPEVLELLNAAQLINQLAINPDTTNPYWMQFLSLPCWQLSPIEVINFLQATRAARKTVFTMLTESDSAKLTAVAQFCADLAIKSQTFSADYLLERIIAQIFPSSQLGTPSETYELFSKLNTLRELAKARNTQAKNHSEVYKLADFCELIQKYQQAEIQLLNKSPYRESEDAVTLQTVHSSKGLEYEYVFLIAADNKNWSDSKGNTNRFTLPRNLEFVRHTGGSLDEKIRVFFVAITRAKAHLILTYSLSDFAGNESEHLKFLDIRDNEAKESISQVIRTPDFARVHKEQGDTDALAAQIAPSFWYDHYLPSDTVRQELLKPLVEHYRISPTHLNHFIDLNYGGPESFLLHYIIGAPSDTSISLSYGILAHEIMDRLNKEQLSNEAALDYFKQAVEQCDLTSEEKADLINRADCELQQFLTARGDQIRQTRADSEVNFARHNIVLGDTPITGKIDRIELHDDTKTITVSDFKTGHPRNKWSTSDNTFAYKIQLYFYKFLIENHPDYRNYQVTTGRIDFIAPDQDSEIVSLELEFKSAEAEEIRTLIQRVYQYVKQLQLPDVSAALATSNPNKAFFEQLIA